MKVTGGTRTRNPQSHNLVLHQVELRSQATLRIRTSTYLSNAAIGSDSRTRTCNPLLNRELRYRITLCRNIGSFYRQTSYSSQREQIVRFSRKEVVAPRLSTSFYESSAGYSGSRCPVHPMIYCVTLGGTRTPCPHTLIRKRQDLHLHHRLLRNWHRGGDSNPCAGFLRHPVFWTGVIIHLCHLGIAMPAS